MSEPRYCPVSRKWCTCETRCEDARFRRRLLAVVVLVLGAIPLALMLSGCATPDVACGMRADYQQLAMPAQDGEVWLRWHFNAQEPAPRYGITRCWTRPDGERACRVDLNEAPPRFNDICGLARLGHEVVHPMGAHHDEP
jgi:hypothetical protein